MYECYGYNWHLINRWVEQEIKKSKDMEFEKQFEWTDALVREFAAKWSQNKDGMISVFTKEFKEDVIRRNFAQKPAEKKEVFKTEDGYEIKNGDMCHLITVIRHANSYIYVGYVGATIPIMASDLVEHHYFREKKNAMEFRDANELRFTKKQIEDAMLSNKTSTVAFVSGLKDGEAVDTKDLMVIHKSKLGL